MVPFQSLTDIRNCRRSLTMPGQGWGVGSMRLIKKMGGEWKALYFLTSLSPGRHRFLIDCNFLSFQPSMG